jgi:hypothetical protein
LETVSSFKKEIQEDTLRFDHYFESTVEAINKSYSIKDFAEKNLKLIYQLIYLSLYAIPCQKDDTPLLTQPQWTLDALQRDTHTILQPTLHGDNSVLVIIPNFFLYLYVKVAKVLGSFLDGFFLKNWDNLESGSFEVFAAEYEAFRTNLFISMGTSSTTISNFYRNAHGPQDTLQRPILLKKIDRVWKALNRFPDLPLVDKEDSSSSADWRSEFVVVNAKGAQFADSFVYRPCDAADDKGILFALQSKLYENTPFPINLIKKEHEKNKKAIAAVPTGSILDKQGIKRARCITVIITTAKIDGDIPDDCIVICKDNFKAFFGAPFALRASLDSGNNVNFPTNNTLVEIRDDLKKHGPFESEEDLLKKVPLLKRKEYEKFVHEASYLPYAKKGMCGVLKLISRRD